MTATRVRTLVLLAAGVTAVTWWAMRMTVGRGAATPPDVPWLVVAVELVIAGVVLSMGWAVRQYQRGRRPLLDPVRAARTAVLAKASCYTGALLTGWYGGQALSLLTDADVPGNSARAGSAGVAVVGAVVLAVVGLVVEHWCRIPPPDAEEPAVRRRTEPDPSAG
ncbi:DUF3180 domain-containing protein [Cellulomonas sp. zg-ZUI222]|uniref:DUF3180 domain-containing protein n=1 Tax=Cellulomonas wangleii TaxID=2816956 RepID=A0ABX8D6A7_9CELL|nr:MULTISPECIES: DUF3180 domain-containing protein [Cellulomonas]MBO0901344.1 DUF3180 domain-containing protein [Cellulomonas sp. zg-ZUI22]MBO0921790.1 DUF3180 domain-containing protein [Cellulomonas wangleii]MBO0924788.1 DUF3180 domain-containing protein [Cellulomonas wangleii]QVI62960.1 DUF3180 domain-containing protein [Cellulomonas wangleii]